jgi:hypothetical protein
MLAQWAETNKTIFNRTKYKILCSGLKQIIVHRMDRKKKTYKGVLHQQKIYDHHKESNRAPLTPNPCPRYRPNLRELVLVLKVFLSRGR